MFIKAEKNKSEMECSKQSKVKYAWSINDCSSSLSSCVLFLISTINRVAVIPFMWFVLKAIYTHTPNFSLESQQRERKEKEKKTVDTEIRR